MTTAKIIRVTDRCIAFFLTAALRQFFDSKLCRGWFQKISQARNLRTPDLVGSSEKGGKAPQLTKSFIPHWLSLRRAWSNLVTSLSRPIAPACVIFLHLETFISLISSLRTSWKYFNKRTLKIQWLHKKNWTLNATAVAWKKFHDDMTGQLTTSTSWKYDAVSRQNSMVPGSIRSAHGKPHHVSLANFSGVY